jgi:hypothetical protein
MSVGPQIKLQNELLFVIVVNDDLPFATEYPA